MRSGEIRENLGQERDNGQRYVVRRRAEKIVVYGLKARKMVSCSHRSVLELKRAGEGYSPVSTDLSVLALLNRVVHRR